MKRAFDILFSFILLVIFCPVLMTFSLLILQDFSNPLYISERAAKEIERLGCINYVRWSKTQIKLVLILQRVTMSG